MENLPNELLLIISLKLDLNSMINFSSVNKNNFKLLDDNFFEELYELYYNSNLWKIICKRPLYNSKALNNFKLELLRIENFQQCLDYINNNRWTKKDFYNYWKNNENIILNI